MAQIFKNNTTGTLASELAAGATACTLNAGHTFTDPGSDWYLATLVGVTGTTETSWEIVRVTDVSTNTLTITRAQESTSDATWPAGTRIEARLTAGATESKANLGAAAYKAVGTGSGDVAAGNRGVTNGDSHDHNGGDGAQIAYSSLSGLPTLGTAAATASTDYATAAKGVTNGDSHDHNGGDGAQIAYSSLSGLPTLGTAAATASTDYVPDSFLDVQIGNRNVTVNGDLSQWQLGTSGFSNWNFCADHWYVGWAGTDPSVAQGAAYGAFPYHLQWSYAAGTTFIWILFPVESRFAQRLAAASKITLSGYLYSSVASSIYVALRSFDVKDVGSAHSSRKAENVDLAGTGWQYFTISYSSPHADIANGLHISFYQEGVAAGTYGVTGVQLEVGDATPFEHRPPGVEQALCRRYLRKSDFYVPGSTAQNLGVIDMFKTPTISGGGSGFTSTGTTKDVLIAYQTTGGVQTLTLLAEP